jgi:uncharacterized protein (DUF983 family)
VTVVSDEHRCPRCGSYSVRKNEVLFAAVSVLELACESCKHEEERRSDASDYAAFLERWRGRLRVPIYDYDEDLVDVD